MRLEINGEAVEAEAQGDLAIVRLGDRLLVRGPDGTRSAVVVRRGDTTFVSIDGSVHEVRRPTGGKKSALAHGVGEARAPMPGQIVEVTVAVGQVVSQGQKLAVLEAMKMQQPIVAGLAGTVTSVGVSVGDQVTEGFLVAMVSADEAPS